MNNKTITKAGIGELARLQREVAQLRRDAERYRWLRDATGDWEAVGIHWGQPSYWPLERLSGEQLDATVDGALKGAGK